GLSIETLPCRTGAAPQAGRAFSHPPGHLHSSRDTPMSTSRRTFVVTTATGVASLAGAPAVFARRDHDLVIRGGWIYDGNGRPGTLGDIAISGDRIVAIAPRIAER